MPNWGLVLVGAGGLAVVLILVWCRDRRFFLTAAMWFVAAGAAGVSLERWESGSLRSGLLVPVLGYPALLVVTSFRPGAMFALMEAKASSDPATRDAARRNGWRLTARIAICVLIVAAIAEAL